MEQPSICNRKAIRGHVTGLLKRSIQEFAQRENAIGAHPRYDRIGQDLDNIMITAIVLTNTAQGHTPEVAQALIDLPGVTEVYSVAGPYDLVAIVRVRLHDELADIVAGHIQKIPGVEATNTLIAFRAYSQRDLEAMWDIGNDEAAN